MWSNPYIEAYPSILIISVNTLIFIFFRLWCSLSTDLICCICLFLALLLASLVQNFFLRAIKFFCKKHFTYVRILYAPEVPDSILSFFSSYIFWYKYWISIIEWRRWMTKLSSRFWNWKSPMRWKYAWVIFLHMMGIINTSSLLHSWNTRNLATTILLHQGGIST